jgi:hypothetical protein
MHNPGEQHMSAVMRILSYFKGNPGKGVLFRKNGHFKIECYTDADWADQQMIGVRHPSILPLLGEI